MKKDRSRAGFIFIFLIIVIPALILYNYYRDRTAPWLVERSYSELSALIIKIVTPGEMIEARGRILASPGMDIVEIGPECDGVAGMLILAAALLAFPRRLRDKFKGLLLGLFYLYIINLARIITLYYIYKYRPDLFELSHIYIGQAVFIIAGITLFLIWSGQWAVKDEITEAG